MLIEIQVKPIPGACPKKIVQKILNLQTFINPEKSCIAVKMIFSVPKNPTKYSVKTLMRKVIIADYYDRQHEQQQQH